MLPRPLPRLITVLGLLAICLGASSDSCSFGDFFKSDGSGTNPDFVTELRLKNANAEFTDSFALDDEITLVLTVRNRLTTSATAEFTSTRISDFVVVRENSTEVVWKWSTGETFTPGTNNVEFGAGETKTYPVVWDQIGDNAVPVPAGTYEARGVLFYAGFDADPLQTNQMGSTLVRFTIR